MKTPLFSFFRKAWKMTDAGRQLPGYSIDDLIEHHHHTRRRFLKTSAQLGMVAGVARPVAISQLILGAGKPNIAIVGAGLAGLSAANFLRKKGIAAKIYESDKQVGGRIKSTKTFGQGQLTTELGGEFIDSNHQDLLHLIKDLGLRNDLLDTQDDALNERSTIFIRGEHHSLRELIEELNAVYPEIRRDQSRLHEPAVRTQFDNISTADYIDCMPVSLWVQCLLNAAFLGENGLETSEQSALNFLTAFGADANTFKPFGVSDERYKLAGGNGRIITRLAERVADNILFEHRLEAVHERSDNSVLLRFNQNGTLAEQVFDAVILTLPFSILRNIDFAVGVCDEKCQAIQELYYGTNTKFILETRERVWRRTGSAGFLYNEVVHNGWDSSQMLTDNKGTGTYTVLFGGESAITATPGTETAQSERCVPVLEEAFPGFSEALTGKRQLAYWPGNPHVHAGYSCYGIGQVTRFGGQAFAPVNNIFFAGEHCSDQFWGFMNGAAETGRLAAQMVWQKVVRR